MLKQILMLAAAATVSAFAGVNTDLLHISDLGMNASDDAMTVNMTINPSEYRVASNKYVRLTPILTNSSDTLRLPSVTVAGNRAWYYEVRNNNNAPSLLRAGKDAQYEYSATVPYEKWMEVSQLAVICDTLNECNCKPPLSSIIPIGDINTGIPQFNPDNTDLVYEPSKENTGKIYTLSGRANIIFKVNKTDIDWSYMTNYAELDSIMKSINAVKDNEYATVEMILLTGYASPEGSYANNVRLAKGRTETVKQYVMKHSDFPASVYKTAFVPEDWVGLREWLENNTSIPNREAMISFIDDAKVPVETKNDVFRARFPGEYPFLLKNVYPLLRHTDYKITYKVRKFYDLDEIAHILKTNPRLLSLDELYLLAGKYKPGSTEYDQIYITAASMFPDSEIANLNAASSSLSQGNLKNAKMFLDKVKPTPVAKYTLGIYYAMMKEYDLALKYLRQASEEGFSKADKVIPQVETLAKPVERLKVL